MHFLALLIGALAVIYALLDCALLLGLRNLRYRKRISFLDTEKNQASVAILVCARNEEANLPACLDSLLAQDFKGDWEIWVADDRSTDSTPQILAQYCNKYPTRMRSLRIETVPTGLSPKKHAITRLVEQVSAEILLLTDADCELPATWATGMLAQFKEGVDWVSGYSYFPATGSDFSVLNGIQALDFQSHRTVDAAGVGLGMPITACGQNLSYRRSVFIELNGFEGVDQVTSGDDDLLMHKLAAKRSKAIRYCTDPGTFVKSVGAKTWKQAWEQRKRWASKTTHYTPQTIFLLGSVFLFYVLILVGLAVGALLWAITGSWALLGLFAMAFAWKTFWDGLVMLQGMILFRSLHLGLWFLPTALLHIPGIVGAVVAGLRGKFTWKG